MGKLRKLQERYLKGELTKAQYEAEVKKLLDDDTLDQDAYDDALDYDPDYERPKYSQAEVDSTIAKKAVKMVRKALKDAGVTIEADDKTLLSKVAETIKSGGSDTGGEGGAGAAISDADLEVLRTKAARADDLEDRCKTYAIENAVLKEAGKYNPVNPSQVVRAIRLDYLDGIDFDEETGKVDDKSLARAIRKVHDNEPNLFKEVGADEDDKGSGGSGSSGNFRGKGPGGAGEKKDAELAAKKEQALAMLGIKKEEK
jgi:hypothetical protein